MPKILLIDDDVELVDMLKEYLEKDGFEVWAAHDGEQGAVLALSDDCALVVLDVMMPRIGGVDTLRRIRLKSNVPVLMLTAKGDELDRILGLELGADDYVPKPCAPRELAARIRAILRRTQSSAGGDRAPAPLVVGRLVICPAQRLARWGDRQLDLTSSEFNLLEVLAQYAGQPVSKSELSMLGLGRPLARFDRNIDVHLSSLRQKLGTMDDGRSCIQTVYRLGYQLVKE